MEASTQTTPIELDDQAVIKPALHHVNLKTTRLDEMIAWYTTVVGMKANFQSPMGAFLTNDSANHRLALTCLPGLEIDDNRVVHDTMHHTAFEYGSLDDLLGSFLRLRCGGITPHACVDHGLTMSFYYLDPDGNSVELQADNFGDWAQSTAFLQQDPRFVEDPIGKIVDPDALVALRQSGVEPSEVHERAYANEFPASGPVDMRMPLPGA